MLLLLLLLLLLLCAQGNKEAAGGHYPQPSRLLRTATTLRTAEQRGRDRQRAPAPRYGDRGGYGGGGYDRGGYDRCDIVHPLCCC